MTRLMTLQELYDEYRNDFERRETRPNPSLLLILLLLQDKNKFKDSTQNFLDFYNNNKIVINKRIKQVMTDFSTTLKLLGETDDLTCMFLDDKVVVQYGFEPAIATLITALKKYPKFSPEEIYNRLYAIIGGKPLTQIRDNVIPYSKLSPLQRRYRQYLNRFKRDGKLPSLDKLLALLLLPEKDKFVFTNGIAAYSIFYNQNKFLIDNGIKQLMTDFSFTEEELPYIYKSLLAQREIKPIEDETNMYLLNRALFKNGWFILAVGLDLYPNQSPERIWNNLCDLVDGEPIPEYLIPKNSANKIILPKLNIVYKQYLIKFRKTGVHPHPSELLAILLFREKDALSTIECDDELFRDIIRYTEDGFYGYHKNIIGEKIEKVIKDFSITKEEMIGYIGKMSSDEWYENFKTWIVFAKGFVMVHSGIISHPDWSPERLYNASMRCWGKDCIPDDLIREANVQSRTKKKHKTKRKISTITTGFKF